MKSINPVFEDDEFERLKQAKGSMTWRKFILDLLEKKKE